MRELANALRFLSIDMVERAKSGHPGLPMGMADVVTVLFRDFLKFRPHDPLWANRDRFILSAGHGSALLYSLLYLLGYPDITLDELKKFRSLGSLTPGHPEYAPHHGIETTTGPLGQGFANAVGMALAERISHDRDPSSIDYRIYVLASDGDLMEGISHEVASIAGHNQLSKLIVLWDDNRITIDGPTSLSQSDDVCTRFQALNWNTITADGHNESSIQQALEQAQTSQKPTLIACRTQIGFGSPNKQGTSDCHGSPLGATEVAATRENLNWPHVPFEIPESIMQTWRNMGDRTSGQSTPHKIDLSHVHETLDQLDLPNNLASRQLSQHVLEALTPIIPELIGGSADLTPSNNTQTQEHKKGKLPYLRYGVREHGMAGCMNGLALSGFIPYGGTFLTFSDYMRPSMRLSAIMRLRVIYILTHDSIGLGEDGPTHQPIEHLSALQAIPHLSIWRPANGLETTEAWRAALMNEKMPTVLALSRQSIHVPQNKSLRPLIQKGGYIIQQSEKPDIRIISSGSEVEIALQAAELLKTQNIQATVVSIPSLDVFLKQDINYQQSVLGTEPRIVIEASEGQRWGCLKPDLFIGLSDYGASAPAADVYKAFGLTAKKVSQKILHSIFPKHATVCY